MLDYFIGKELEFRSSHKRHSLHLKKLFEAQKRFWIDEAMRVLKRDITRAKNYVTRTTAGRVMPAVTKAHKKEAEDKFDKLIVPTLIYATCNDFASKRLWTGQPTNPTDAANQVIARSVFLILTPAVKYAESSDSNCPMNKFISLWVRALLKQETSTRYRGIKHSKATHEASIKSHFFRSYNYLCVSRENIALKTRPGGYVNPFVIPLAAQRIESYGELVAFNRLSRDIVRSCDSPLWSEETGLGRISKTLMKELRVSFLQKKLKLPAYVSKIMDGFDTPHVEELFKVKGTNKNQKPRIVYDACEISRHDNEIRRTTSITLEPKAGKQ